MNKNILSWGAITSLIAFSPPVHAAVTTLSGGLSTGYEYFDREPTNSASSSQSDIYSRFRISPFVTITSETPRQKGHLQYGPSFWYDFDKSEHDVDHSLTLDYLRFLTQHWSLSLADDLAVTDAYNDFSVLVDPQTGDIISNTPGENVSGAVLRDERGRRRYTNNTTKFGTSYTYFEDSSISMDYLYSLLRNNVEFSGSNYQDYDKHDVSVTLAHRLDSRWKVTAIAGYVRGLYNSVGNNSGSSGDSNNNLKEYRTSLLVDRRLSAQHSLNGKYAYNQSDYDSDQKSDNEIHSFTAGWVWNVSPELSLRMGAGPTYNKSHGSSGNWGSNANFNLNYLMERGRIELRAAHGTTFDNFSGTNDRDMVEFWNLQSIVNYSVGEYTDLNAFLGYANQDRTSVANSSTTNSSVNEKTYSTGCGVSHRFAEKYIANLSYHYLHHTSDDPGNRYDDNQIAMTISYQNDFLQW